MDHCSNVTSADLDGISFLDLHGQDIAALGAGDFSGLLRLRELWLYDNALTSLPEGIFADLLSLRNLRLGGNALTSLPERTFADLPVLRRLYLSDNVLPALPEGAVRGPLHPGIPDPRPQQPDRPAGKGSSPVSTGCNRCGWAATC